MTRAHSLFELLEAAGSHLHIYDMGRRVCNITRSQFLDFENTLIPYPLPLQAQAWLGLAMEDTQHPGEPTIWFLRLPLDEQGKLVLASRDYFVHRLLESAIDSRTEQESETQTTDAFKDNPYVFKPRAERMAVFHAKLSRDLGRSPSQFFDHARKYFNGSLGWDQWKFVGYQGIADLAARSLDTAIETDLALAIPQLPPEPLTALCHCLENEPIETKLGNALLQRLLRELNAASPDIVVLSALIRGISFATRATQRQQMFEAVMNHPLSSQLELLAAISGRAWELLRQDEQMARFAEALSADTVSQAEFNECITDLLRLPGFRGPVLGAVRRADRSDQLAGRFHNMMQQLQSGNSTA